MTVTSSYVSAVLPALLILGLGFGMIFAPAINTATFGVARRDSGVASALVNTMQQARRLNRDISSEHHRTQRDSQLFGLGVILAIVLLPSKRRLAELRRAADAAQAAAAAPVPSRAAAPRPSPATPAPPRSQPSRRFP